MDRPFDELRVMMAGVGVLTLAAYGVLAVLVSVALRVVWASRPDPLSVAATLVAITLLSGYLTYRFGTGTALTGLDARALPRSHVPDLYALSDGLAASMDHEAPPIYVARLGEPNALILGGRTPALVVDHSLFSLLTAPEFEGVLAHEFAHLEAGDGLAQSIAHSAVHTVVGVAALALAVPSFVLRGFATGLALLRGTPGAWRQTVPGRLRLTLANALTVLLVTLTLLVRAYARRREFAADDRAVEVTGRPLALARALRKIERSRAIGGPFSRGSAGVDEDRPLARLLSTHPAVEDRIERLRAKSTDSEAGSEADGGWRRVPVEG